MSTLASILAQLTADDTKAAEAASSAGFAYGLSGRNYAVVGIINHPNAGAARPALDRLVEWAVRDAP